MKPSTAQMALEALSCHFCGHKTAVRIVSAEELSRESEEDGDAPSFYPHSDAFAVMCDASTTLGLGGCGATAGFAETELAAVARWNARCTSADLAAKVEPFGWTVSGCNEILKGEYAESDAKSDAARCGGTACAIALYEAPQQAEAPKSFEKLYAENSQGIEIERLKMQVESLTAERDALRADAERITKELLKCQQNQ